MRKFEFVKRVENIENLKLPERSTKNSAGYDFFAIEDVEIVPVGHDIYTSYNDHNLGSIVHRNTKPTVVKTGVKAKMLHNEFLLLANRSSNPGKKDLVLANGVGIIDSDYYGNPDNDGEIMFPFYNVGTEPIEIKKGDKLGQGIFMKYALTDDDNAVGERTGGFGSTGK